MVTITLALVYSLLIRGEESIKKETLKPFREEDYCEETIYWFVDHDIRYTWRLYAIQYRALGNTETHHCYRAIVSGSCWSHWRNRADRGDR